VQRRNLEFACAVMAIGLLAGLAGMTTTVLLHAIEHFTYNYTFGSLLDGVSGAGRVRRVIGPMIGGALAGWGWWMLRRRTSVPALDSAIARREPLPRLALSLDAGFQVLVVGSGASLGREGAPRQLAAALGDLGTSRWALTARDRELLLCCAAGAGLAAVYSVPIGGALFTLRILLRTWDIRAVGTALITSSLAVAVAAPVTHDATTLRWPEPELSYLLTAAAVLLSPLALAVGLGFNRMMDHARSRSHPTSWWIIPAIAGAGLLVGICSHWWPELPGNGKSILTVSLNSGLTLSSAAAILLLKPLITAVFLRAGAVGGLMTPALATGAALGAAFSLAVNAWTTLDVSTPVVALACAAGVLAITQKTPSWAAIFVWELARPPIWLLIVFAAAACAAHLLGRIVRPRS
jgi:H+/Cl- antiporter ClcA